MEEIDALSELNNQQRPVRRNDRTYGKKKAPGAKSRAMHYNLFGGGGDENKIEHYMGETKDDAQAVDGMEKLTIASHDRETPDEPVFAPTSSTTQKPTVYNLRLRGRRKLTPQKKMAALTPDKLQALSPLLHIVGQEGVKDFQDFGRSMGKKYLCTKIGEGSYADVYELKAKDLDEAQKLEKRGGLIIKVIPFRMTSSGKDDIADLDTITREIRLFQTVDALHGFVRCRGTHIVSGAYPDVLLEAFDTFKATHSSNSAQNPNPQITAAKGQQLYAILEMNHAGTPLGKLRSASAFQVFDLFWKTAISLALAEKEVDFEHRDLHNGNICWKPLDNDGPHDIKQDVVEEMKEKPEVILGLSNLEITIIDYTLSRATIRSESEGDLIIFDRMEYWDVVYVEDDRDTEADKRQFRTYAEVRNLARKAEADAMAMAELERAEYKVVDKFERFIPKTNVLWLRYVLADLLARGGGGRGASLPGSSRAAKKLQLELWKTLGEVEAYLNGTTLALLPAGADDFVCLAVEMGWLAEGDVAAFRAQTEE